MRKYSKVYATNYCKEITPGTDDEHPEGGFRFYTGKVNVSGCMEGQAIAIGELLGNLMNHDWMTFEDRVDYANLINQIMESLDDSGEARRALHLATRDREML